MNTEKVTVELLQARGFGVFLWDMQEIGVSLQITDATGITFYMPIDSTFEQCLERYAVKQRAFERAEQMK